MGGVGRRTSEVEFMRGASEVELISGASEAESIGRRELEVEFISGALEVERTRGLQSEGGGEPQLQSEGIDGQSDVAVDCAEEDGEGGDESRVMHSSSSG